MAQALPSRPNLDWLAGGWHGERMDALLLLASTVRSVGYNGRGDFRMGPDGRLSRRPEREVAPFAYAGAAILHPRFFADCPAGDGDAVHAGLSQHTQACIRRKQIAAADHGP